MAYGEKDTHKPLIAINENNQVMDMGVGYTKQDARQWMKQHKISDSSMVMFCRPVCILSGEVTVKLTEHEVTDVIKKQAEDDAEREEQDKKEKAQVTEPPQELPDDPETGEE